MLIGNELFDRDYYLSIYPDVAAAVANGMFANPIDHFNQFGQFERRNPSGYFDTTYYLQHYQDVANEVNAGQTTAFAHFITFGQTENRNPNPLLDTTYYLQRYQDVAEAVASDRLTGVEHFIEFGDLEGRSPSRFLDTGFYLSRNPDVVQAVKQGTTRAAEHFIEFGQFEGRIPRQLFSDIYLFGDSQSDDGNLFAITNGFSPPSPPYFNGRFSNGPIWQEYLAPRVELVANPDNNVAIGGAETGTNDVLIPGFPAAPGLQHQVDNFVTTHPSADPKALYIVYAGGNDYFGGNIDVNPTVNNLSTAVTKLAAVGARNFMMPNLPNPSGSPVVVSQGSEAVKARAELVDRHAAALKAATESLEQNPNINVTYVDFTGFLRGVQANPQNYGITNLGGIVPGVAFDPDLVSNFTVPPGIDPNGYMYWDQVHLSTRTHQLLADTALRTTTAISEVVEIL